MCGRFVRHSTLHELAREFGADEPSFDAPPNYNVAPSQEIAVVLSRSGGRKLALCRWGLIPSWAKEPKTGYTMINARGETAADKPVFRQPFRDSRILIPANGFYEWEKRGTKKTPIFIRVRSRGLFAFAGLLSIWTSPEGDKRCTCAIITTEAADSLKGIHDRMPVIIHREDESVWLDHAHQERDGLTDLLRPFDSEDMEHYPVSEQVNSPSYNSPACIRPAAD